MKEEISEKEYKALFLVGLGRTNLDWLADEFANEEETKNILNLLEKKKLIQIEFRDEKIYGFIETREGKKILRSAENSEWWKKMEEEF